jgi:phosphoribosylanthranilate isomerase
VSLRPSIAMMTLAKVCGITRLEDGLSAAAEGAVAVGFIFWPNSPRYIDPKKAREITEKLPPFVTPVGVFVDTPPSEVERVVRVVGLEVVQLHGQELCSDYAKIGVRLIKSVAVGKKFSREILTHVPENVTVLLDAHDPVRMGGTGQPIDWTIGARIARERRVVLSGGLHPDNVCEAIKVVAPYAVDVSSGVEDRPGIKNHELVRAFMKAIQR